MPRKPKTQLPPDAIDAPINFAELAANTKEGTLAGTTVFNPFTELLRESYYLDQRRMNGEEHINPVKELPPVLGYQAIPVARLLRRASAQLDAEEIGIRIRFSYVDDEDVIRETGATDEVPKDGRDVSIKFWGRPRRFSPNEKQKAEMREQGFVKMVGDEERFDTAAYLDWVRERQASADEQAGASLDDYDNGDNEDNGEDES